MSARASVLGWVGAATSAAAVLSGAAALAITARPAPPPLVLDLGQGAPAIAAIAEVAPKIASDAPAELAPTAAEPQTTTDIPAPTADERPRLPDTARAPELPKPDVVASSDLDLPRPAPPKPKTAAKAEPVTPKAEPAPKPKTAQSKKEKPAKAKAKVENPAKADKPAAVSAGSTAQQKGQSAKGGAPKVSAAAYAKAVMKKVRNTKRKSGAGKGVAVVGFTVAADGGLAAVKILRSSGNAALDKIALNHIQRAAPFAPPPEGAGHSFSFEFVGK